MVCKPFQQPTIGDYVSITPERSIPNNKPPLEKVYGIKFATLVHLCFHGYAVNTLRLQLLSQCTERFGVRQPRTLRGISAPVRAHDENGAPLNPLAHTPMTLLKCQVFGGIPHLQTRPFFFIGKAEAGYEDR